MQKNAKTQKMQKKNKHYTNENFFTKFKNPETEIVVFCVITFEPTKI